MDAAAKKTALRMIPYGLYVLTSESGDDGVTASTVNWVTQASFEPPLVVIGVKKDSSAYKIVSETRFFALNVLGKGQQALAFNFFKPATRDGDTIGGQPVRRGQTGAPILVDAVAAIECQVVDLLAGGDHAIVVGEVVNAEVARAIDGRPDDATLTLKDLGEKTFYGG
ncbi:MAG TPA: flavin reductase family protein [Candidatus Binatia bacterium]|nr:flavin reductase family protein [Candidatus Binatia bacterium]